MKFIKLVIFSIMHFFFVITCEICTGPAHLFNSIDFFLLIILLSSLSLFVLISNCLLFLLFIIMKVGVIDEKRILPLGSEISAVGVCTYKSGVPEIRSCKDLPYFL